MRTLVKFNRTGIDFPYFLDSCCEPGGFCQTDSDTWSPAVNVAENAGSFTIEVAAPGLDKKDFNVTIDRNILTVRCERKEESEENKLRFTRREFGFMAFRRSFTLPSAIDTEAISGRYENGILTLELPKRDDAKERSSREIQIS